MWSLMGGLLVEHNSYRTKVVQLGNGSHLLQWPGKEVQKRSSVATFVPSGAAAVNPDYGVTPETP
jgi:hypothetical protein